MSAMSRQPRPDESSVAQRIAAARGGSREALGEILESCRAYLLLVANKNLGRAYRTKDGASDLVQQTFVDAQRSFDRFGGETPEELLAWLSRILKNNLMNYRDFASRRLVREVALAAEAQGTQDPLVDDQPTPCTAASQREMKERLDRAVLRLPERQRQVVLWRSGEHCSFAEIGRRLGKSEDAAYQVWNRAVTRLREILTTGSQSESNSR
jgi:RNA polymerase sigma-70 factor (ECF subfamily)